MVKISDDGVKIISYGDSQSTKKIDHIEKMFADDPKAADEYLTDNFANFAKCFNLVPISKNKRCAV